MTILQYLCFSSSIIRTIFFDADRKSTPQASDQEPLTSKSLADTPIVSVAYIRRALTESHINPPSSCSLQLGKKLLKELGVAQNLRRECNAKIYYLFYLFMHPLLSQLMYVPVLCLLSAVSDGRLIFSALLMLAHQYNRPSTQSQPPQLQWMELTSSDNSNEDWSPNEDNFSPIVEVKYNTAASSR